MVENNNQKATTEGENNDRTIAVYKAIWSIFSKGFHESISEAPTHFFVIRELIVSWVLRKMKMRPLAPYSIEVELLVAKICFVDES